jgi:hypothetical protein
MNMTTSRAVRGIAFCAVAIGLVMPAAGCSASAAGHAAKGRAASRRTAPQAATASLAAAVSGFASPAPARPPARAGGYDGPHFSTPQAAMRYLAWAYNHHDNRALHAVTRPQAFKELMAMRAGAVDLRLTSCAQNRGRGDYDCYFIHNYPASMHRSGHGSSTMLVAPALNPGWYMYELVDCG